MHYAYIIVIISLDYILLEYIFVGYECQIIINQKAIFGFVFASPQIDYNRVLIYLLCSSTQAANQKLKYF